MNRVKIEFAQIEHLTKERAMVIEPFEVLILEDNDLVSRLYKMLFRDSAWCITLAENGDEAIEVFVGRRNSGRPFDIVILDLEINGEAMAGLRVFEELKLVDPEVRGILCSGSIDQTVRAKCVEIGFLATLDKPFTRPDLQSVLRSVSQNM